MSDYERLLKENKKLNEENSKLKLKIHTLERFIRELRYLIYRLERSDKHDSN